MILIVNDNRAQTSKMTVKNEKTTRKFLCVGGVIKVECRMSIRKRQINTF